MSGTSSSGAIPSPATPEHHHAPSTPFLSLALAALGVVYGDIGTSPLYSVKECFHGLHAMAVTEANVMGVISLVFWALTVVVTIKYVLFIMRADNHGEGGIFALLALLRDTPGTPSRFTRMVPAVALVGAALLYGDGVITPAISVLSAVEGLNMATEAAAPYILPITCTVLTGLFLVQRLGTARIGIAFGPVMIVWFISIATIGLATAVGNPRIFAAVNPWYAVNFFMENNLHGLVVLGSVVLCITGGEALYADMGHFGPKPIRLSWLAMVFPALMCNYFGQGALLLADPSQASNPFYAMVPRELLYPMVALSTVATVIASQAMISGVFSLTQQAIQLGFAPRMHIVHTSGEASGQIYLPGVNYALMFACLALVLGFKESSGLAGAYGIAVTATMGMTSLLYYAVCRRRWGWKPWQAVPLVILFLIFDTAFLGANLLKIVDGGWVTLSMAAVVVLLMLTWRDGRSLLARGIASATVPLEAFLEGIRRTPPHRVQGTGVFMSVSPEGTPLTLLHNFKHNRILHETVVLLSITSAPMPEVAPGERLAVTPLGEGFFRIVARYGFMETPNVPEIARLAAAHGLAMRMETTTFYLGRETLLIGKGGTMSVWRKTLFAFMSRNAWNATTFFSIPPGRVVELGARVEL